MFNQKQNGIQTSASAAAVAGAVHATTAANASQEVTEARQEAQIWTAFALNSHLRGSELTVSVRDGKAVLLGKVADVVNKDLARQIVLGVSGITAVDNNLEVDANHTRAGQSAQRAFGELVDDATITAKVKSKMLWSRHGDSIKADVETARGKVSLTGFVDSAEAKEFAGKAAANTRGVRSVNNQLVVEGAKAGVLENVVTDIADGWITAKVKSTFRLSTQLDSSEIGVSTQAGIVKLSGKADSIAERVVAIELAGSIRGVKSVDSVALTM